MADVVIHEVVKQRSTTLPTRRQTDSKRLLKRHATQPLESQTRLTRELDVIKQHQRYLNVESPSNVVQRHTHGGGISKPTPNHPVVVYGET